MAFTEETARVVGQYVQKPKLTEKLLSKPPVRFLYDVTVALLSELNYAPEVFASEDVNDRDGKLRFLNKLIAFTAAASGAAVQASARKIAQGQDPEATNELLVQLAKAVAARRVAPEVVVRKVAEATGEESALPPPPVLAPRAEPSGPSEDELQAQRESEERERKRREHEKRKAERKARADAEAAAAAAQEQAAAARAAEERARLEQQEARAQRERDDQEAAAAIGRPSSRKGGRSHAPPAEPVAPPTEAPPVASAIVSDSERQTYVPAGPSQRPASALRRPQTAGRAPPRKLNVVKSEDAKAEVVEPQHHAEAAAAAAAKIITDNDGEESDEDMTIAQRDAPGAGVQLSGEHGGLVKDILSAQQQQQQQQQQRGASDAPADAQPIIKPKKQKAGIQMSRRVAGATKGASGLDVQKLGEQIKQLVQIVTPLGRALDFALDDVDSMTREGERWSAEIKVAADQLEKERQDTDIEIQPMLAQLRDCDRAIEAKREELQRVRANVVRNEAKITQMLRSVTQTSAQRSRAAY